MKETVGPVSTWGRELHSKNEGDSGTSVYMGEGTTSKVMEADRPYGEFYDFYSINSEYFGYTIIQYNDCPTTDHEVG
jgi:hypothetical protein